MECQLYPYVLPNMEDAALDGYSRPTTGNGEQYAFLAVTDDYSGWREMGKQLCPGVAGLPANPTPANDELWCSGNQTDQATNPNTIQQDYGVYLTSLLRVWSYAPTSGCLLTPGSVGDPMW